MRVAIDAMGGDHAPGEVVRGAVEAARRAELEVILVGQAEAVQAELSRHDTAGLPLRIVPASEVVAMDEHPVAAVRSKKDSSLVVGMDLLKRGEADAFVSAGNSGAVMAAALFRLGRIPGIERPAIGVLIPTQATPAFIIDIGANADCRPAHLLQFARMGSAYMQRVRGLAQPRVALLSNGEEDTKGNQLVLEAHALLRESNLHFVGNVEGKDFFRGAADVLVTDGFTGNVAIKWSEGIAELIYAQLRRALSSRLHYKLAALIVRPAIRLAASQLDYTSWGGAPLLGVEGLVFISHGRSGALAIRNALWAADDAARTNLTGSIREAMAVLARQGEKA